VIECACCSLRYTDPLPDIEELSASYNPEYYAGCHAPSFGAGPLRAMMRRRILRQRERALLNRPPGRILDVGCGSGDFLVALRDRGWEVYGTEFSETAAGLARARGITVANSAASLVEFPDGYFDAVTLWHVLEHLPEPLAGLTKIGRVLRPDGLLVVEVPNSASWSFRLCRQHWDPLKIPQHLQHFTPATLTRALALAGFAPLAWQRFHWWDVTFACYSFLDRLGISRRLGIRSAGDGRAVGAKKAIFGVLGLVTAALSVPYACAAAAMSGNSETITVTSRRAPTDPDAADHAGGRIRIGH
jgi:SAM-dependent methyltransferase